MIEFFQNVCLLHELIHVSHIIRLAGPHQHCLFPEHSLKHIPKSTFPYFLFYLYISTG